MSRKKHSLTLTHLVEPNKTLMFSVIMQSKPRLDLSTLQRENRSGKTPFPANKLTYERKKSHQELEDQAGITTFHAETSLGKHLHIHGSSEG